MIEFLKQLPSGGWVVVGAVTTLVGTALLEVWRARREDRNIRRERAFVIVDRMREERRTVYGELVTAIAEARGRMGIAAQEVALGRQRYEQGHSSPMETQAALLGTVPEVGARARMVASDPVRAHIYTVLKDIQSKALHLATGAIPEAANDPVPILEELLAFELEYRDRPEAVSEHRVDAAVEREFRSVLGDLMDVTKAPFVEAWQTLVSAFADLFVELVRAFAAIFRLPRSRG